MYTKFFTFLLACFLFAACGNSGTNKSKEEGEQELQEETKGSMYDTREFTTKYNDYISYQNSGNRSLMLALDSYYFRFDPNQPIVKNNRPRMSAHNKIDFNRLIKSFNAKPEFENVDAAAQLMHKRAKTLDSLLSISSFYYQKKAYEEDKFEKGKALRAEMEPAVGAYIEHYNNFALAMETLAEKLNEHELKKMKEDGRMENYHMLLSINKAQSILDYIRENSENNFSSIDFTKLDKNLEEFNNSLSELERMSIDDQKFKEAFGTKAMFAKQYIQEGAKFIVTNKEFKKRVQNNNWKFNITHPNIPDEGSFERILKNYRELVQKYNFAI